MIERRRESGIAVAARHDFRFRPDLEADLPQRVTVFGCCATGKENSSAIDLLRQFGKDRAQTVGRGESKIRGLQFSLLQNAKFPTRIIPTCRDYGSTNAQAVFVPPPSTPRMRSPDFTIGYP